MCGIIGITSSAPQLQSKLSSLPQNNTISQLLEALQRLTYRGYDSAGIAFQYSTNNTISTQEITTPNIQHHVHILKSPGKIHNLIENVYNDTIANPTSINTDSDENQSSTNISLVIQNPITTSIGHTRWATHGDPHLTANAHPHQSQHGLFTVVHNGIIENYLELYETYLEPINYQLQSQTDTEIIVALLEIFFLQHHTQFSNISSIPISSNHNNVSQPNLNGYHPTIDSNHQPIIQQSQNRDAHIDEKQDEISNNNNTTIHLKQFQDHNNITSLGDVNPDCIALIIAQVLSLLKGSFALCIFFKGHINTIYATKRSSPLCIGQFQQHINVPEQTQSMLHNESSNESSIQNESNQRISSTNSTNTLSFSPTIWSQTMIASDATTIDICSDLFYVPNDHIVVTNPTTYIVFKPTHDKAPKDIKYIQLQHIPFNTLPLVKNQYYKSHLPTSTASSNQLEPNAISDPLSIESTTRLLPSIFYLSLDEIYNTTKSMTNPTNHHQRDYYMLSEIGEQVQLVKKIATMFFNTISSQSSQSSQSSPSTSSTPFQHQSIHQLHLPINSSSSLDVSSRNISPLVDLSSFKSPITPSTDNTTNNTNNINSISSHIDLSQLESIKFVACGSSFYSSLLGSYYLESIAHITASSEVASEFIYRSPQLQQPYLYQPIITTNIKNSTNTNNSSVNIKLIPKLTHLTSFISQSGETSDTISALQYCQQNTPISQPSISILSLIEHCNNLQQLLPNQDNNPIKDNSSTISIHQLPKLPHILSLVNVEQSTLSRQSDYSLLLNAGVERAVASTKAFLAQSFWLLLFAIYIADIKNKLYKDPIEHQHHHTTNNPTTTSTSTSIVWTNPYCSWLPITFDHLKDELLISLPYCLGLIYNQFYTARLDLISLFQHNATTSTTSTDQSLSIISTTNNNDIYNNYDIMYKYILLNTIRSLDKSRNVLILGRGMLYPIALECALKLKELTYIPTEGYAAGECKHGPIALIDENSLVIALCPYDLHSFDNNEAKGEIHGNDSNNKNNDINTNNNNNNTNSNNNNNNHRQQWFLRTFSNIQEIIARKGKVIVITDELGYEYLSSLMVLPTSIPIPLGLPIPSTTSMESTTTPNTTLQSNHITNKESYFSYKNQNVFIIPTQLSPITQPFAVTMIFQYITYFTALYKNLDVDQPRNLAKSVTVE